MTSTASRILSMPLSKRLTALGMAVCLASPAVSVAQPRTQVKIVLDWILQGPQAIYLRAAESGCFASKGLDVTIDRGYGAGDSIAKVASGQYDIGRSDGNVMIEFVSKNPGGVIIAFVESDSSAAAVMALKKRGLTKPKDLEGKTLAAPPGDASRRLFPVFAAAAGFDATKVRWSNISPELREPALVRGEADAISGLTKSGLLSLKAVGVDSSEVTVFRYDDFGAALLGKAMVVNTAFAQRDPKVVTQVIECLVATKQEAMRDLQPAINALKKREVLTDVAIETERLKLGRDCCWNTANVKANGLSSIDPVRLQNTIDRVSQALMIEPPRREFVYTEAYLPPRSALRLTPN